MPASARVRDTALARYLKREALAVRKVIPDEVIIRSYLDRAEELRTIAQDFADTNVRRMLTNLASDYERMAQRLALNAEAKSGAHGSNG